MKNALVNCTLLKTYVFKGLNFQKSNMERQLGATVNVSFSKTSKCLLSAYGYFLDHRFVKEVNLSPVIALIFGIQVSALYRLNTR